MKKLRILGIRGIPAAHGGSETLAEYLALHLISEGWQVAVYCQEEGKGALWRDEWRGIERVHIPVSQKGSLGTIVFDWRTICDASKYKEPCLTIGYNTAVFTALLRLRGAPNLIEMDGIEWKRSKWGAIAKIWFWLNEWAGSWLGDHLVADHPEIKRHLSTRVRAEKITVIPLGAEWIEQKPDETPLEKLGVKPGQYFTLVARPEPENSILEIVQGFSLKPRGMNLLVLGNYSKQHPFQKKVLDAASDEVIFAGAIYDKDLMRSLRYYCLAYLHGHQVGGTNPSMMEALAVGNAVIAHDNCFNRWVLGESAAYFKDAESLSAIFDDVISMPTMLETMRTNNLHRFQEDFTWPHILEKYDDLLSRFV
jgi:glycosyltransferase involved in cell wall biosynthesis